MRNLAILNANLFNKFDFYYLFNARGTFSLPNLIAIFGEAFNNFIVNLYCKLSFNYY